MQLAMKWMCYLLIFVIGGALSDGVYYISDDPTLCPMNQQCYNLSFYAMYPEDYFTSDTIFYFMEGNHVINNSELILITNASNITLQGLTDTTVTITCVNGSGGLSFYDCNQITLRSLHFHNCGGVMTTQLVNELDDGIAFNYVTRVNISLHEYNKNTHHTLLFAFVTGLDIFGVTVNNSAGRALSALNTYNVHMSHCYFSYSNIDSYYRSTCSYHDLRCIGGNAFFLYLDTVNCLRNTESYYYANISDSSFSYGVDRVSSELLNAGLGFGLYYSSNIGIDVTINSVTLTGNTATNGANFFFGVFTRYHTLTINNMTSTHANSIYPFNNTEGYIKSDETYGGGFMYQTAGLITVPCNNTFSKNDDTNRLTVTNSRFMHNIARDGAGMFLNVLSRSNSIVSERFIKLENCTIRNNSGEVGVAMFLREVSTFELVDQLHFDLINISISSNNLLTTEHDVSSAVYISSVSNITFIDVSITDHDHLTGLHVYSSVINIKETNTTISNNVNSARRGGGIYSCGNSVFVFLPPANLILANNTAAYGGAIYIRKIVIANDMPLCFFQIVDEGSVTTRITPNTHIISINNTATVTGDFLYSSTGILFKCRMTAAFLDYNEPYVAFGKLVILDQQNNYSTISSNPVKACFCDEDGLPDCSITSTSIDVIPGTYFDITVAAVGLEDGVTPGIINYVQNFNGTKNESVYRVENHCTKISRLLYVLEDNTIQLTVDESTVPTDNIPLKIHINVLPCPYGFNYSSAIGSCVCNNYIKDIATCDSTTWNITREGNYWINYSTTKNCTIVFPNCPFGYCNPTSVTFSPTAPDPQCIQNRAGPLCGKCADGFSLKLGSNKCEKCDNNNLALILVFALAGILLVVFIFALNLTVTVGTINGLIFYANIVKLNEYNFFANGSVPILSQFIAWLNLDFGIEVCFFDSLDAYTKTWLQIVFPLYIAGIVVCIIILCRYSSKLSKLVGNNAVPVLATLILLSYIKIVSFITHPDVLHFGTPVLCNGQSYSIVWLVDGSVNSFDVKHGFLVIAALLTLIFIALPYTLLILFIPLIQKKTPRRLKWILKLMPYFDATCGELHDGYRFWSGFLLVIRLVLGLILPFTSSNIYTSAILGTTIIILVIIWNLPLAGLYKRRYLDVLESWFFLNLGFISIMSLNGSGYVGTIISTSLVLATFIGIVICHLCWRIHTLVVKKRENVNLQQQEKKEEPAEWKIKVQTIISYFFDRVELSSHGHTSAGQNQDDNFFIAIDAGREQVEERGKVEMVYFGKSSTQTSVNEPSSYIPTNEISLPTESVITE